MKVILTVITSTRRMLRYEFDNVEDAKEFRNEINDTILESYIVREVNRLFGIWNIRILKKEK